MAVVPVVIASAITPLPGAGSVVMLRVKSALRLAILPYTVTHEPVDTAILYNPYPFAIVTVRLAVALDAKLVVVAETVVRAGDEPVFALSNAALD